MKDLEAGGTLSWQQLGDEGRIAVLGRWVDPTADRVLETQHQQGR
jgi:hypothetical protein